jgi:hypothetical protein
MAAKIILNPAANANPQKITLFLNFSDKPAAAIPIIIALSPDRNMSAKIT